MSKIALLVLDFQNDQCHKDGVFFKNGLFTDNISKIHPNVCNITTFCKNNKIPIIAMQLTILENTNNEACGHNLFKTYRPFLEKEGLRINSWGHDLLEGVKADFFIKRWSMSSFYQTDLKWHLDALGINELLLCGFTTNGIVETTAREAASRNYLITTLTDCTTGYSEQMHEASLSNLSTFSKIINSKDWIENYKNKSQI